MKLYNCKKKLIYPPTIDFISYNYNPNEFKESICVDSCIADEVESLWSRGIRTHGCCCGHGRELGWIQVHDDDIEKMLEMDYVQFLYPDNFGGIGRKDAFVPKSYSHIYDGYSDGYLG